VTLVPIIGFVLVSLLAIGFAAVPLWRIQDRKKRVLALAAVAAATFAIGGGAYFLVGRPHLAQRDAM